MADEQKISSYYDVSINQNFYNRYEESAEINCIFEDEFDLSVFQENGYYAEISYFDDTKNKYTRIKTDKDTQNLQSILSFIVDKDKDIKINLLIREYTVEFQFNNNVNDIDHIDVNGISYYENFEINIKHNKLLKFKVYCKEGYYIDEDEYLPRYITSDNQVIYITANQYFTLNFDITEGIKKLIIEAKDPKDNTIYKNENLQNFNNSEKIKVKYNELEGKPWNLIYNWETKEGYCIDGNITGLNNVEISPDDREYTINLRPELSLYKIKVNINEGIEYITVNNSNDSSLIYRDNFNRGFIEIESILYGSDVTIIPKLKEGYHLENNEFKFVNITKDEEIYIEAILNKYQLTININEGIDEVNIKINSDQINKKENVRILAKDFTNNQYIKEDIPYGASIEISAIEKVGYTVNGNNTIVIEKITKNEIIDFTADLNELSLTITIDEGIDYVNVTSGTSTRRYDSVNNFKSEKTEKISITYGSKITIEGYCKTGYHIDGTDSSATKLISFNSFIEDQVVNFESDLNKYILTVVIDNNETYSISYNISGAKGNNKGTVNAKGDTQIDIYHFDSLEWIVNPNPGYMITNGSSYGSISKIIGDITIGSNVETEETIRTPKANEIWYTTDSNTPISIEGTKQNSYNNNAKYCIAEFNDNINILPSFKDDQTLLKINHIGKQFSELPNDFCSGCTNLTSVNQDVESSEGLNSHLVLKNNLFNGCTKLKTADLILNSLNLGSNNSIPNNILNNCSEVTSPGYGWINNLLKNSESIGNNFLNNCSQLSGTITCNNTKLKNIGNNFLYKCEKLNGTIEINSGNLTSIGSDFVNSTKITTISITNSINLSIGDNFINNCDDLTNLTLSNIQSGNISTTNFINSCSKLNSIDLSNNQALREITPTMFIYIGKSTSYSNGQGVNLNFSNCRNLTSINCTTKDKIDRTESKESVFISSYNGATSSSRIRSINLSGCSALESIGNLFGMNCIYLTNINLTGCNKLSSIGKGFCFANTSIQSIDFSETNLNDVGDWFLSYSSIKSIIFNENSSITNIPNYFLHRCENLNSIEHFNNFINNVQYIGDHFLSGYKKISSDDTDSYKEIISNGYSPTTITMQNDLSNIDIKLSSTLISVGDYFISYTSINSIDLSVCNQLNSIGNYFLSYNFDLNKVSTPENGFSKLSLIKDYFLHCCKKLINSENFDLSSLYNVESIGKYFLGGRTNLYGIGEIKMSYILTNPLLESMSYLGNESKLKTIGSHFMYNCPIKGEINLNELFKGFEKNNVIFGDYFLGNSLIDNLNLEHLNYLVEIPNFFLYNSSKLKNIDLTPLGENLNKIGNGFLFGCDLSEINTDFLNRIGQIQPSIGKNFLSSTSISSLNIAPISYLKQIPDSFLSSCRLLTNISGWDEFNNITKIGNQFLSQCVKYDVDLSEILKGNNINVGNQFLIDVKSISSIESLQNIGKIGEYFMAKNNIQNIGLSKNSDEILNIITNLSNAINDTLPDYFMAYTSGISDISISKFGNNITNYGTGFLSGWQNLESVDFDNWEGLNIIIGDYFLSECNNLQSLDTSTSGANSIVLGTGICMNCEKIESINIIGTSLNSEIKTSRYGIGTEDFNGCLNLKNLSLSILGNMDAIEIYDKISSESEGKAEDQYDDNFINLKPKRKYAYNCFASNSSNNYQLNKIIFDNPKNKDINLGDYFLYGSKVNEIDLSVFKSIKSIGTYFCASSNMTKIILPNEINILSIPAYFLNNAGVESFDFSRFTSITKISQYFMSNLPNIQEIDLSKCTSLIDISWSSFENLPKCTIINLKNGLKISLYKSGTSLAGFKGLNENVKILVDPQNLDWYKTTYSDMSYVKYISAS